VLGIFPNNRNVVVTDKLKLNGTTTLRMFGNIPSTRAKAIVVLSLPCLLSLHHASSCPPSLTLPASLLSSRNKISIPRVNIEVSVFNPGKVMEVKLGTVKPLNHYLKQRTASISSVASLTRPVENPTDEMLAVRCLKL